MTLPGAPPRGRAAPLLATAVLLALAYPPFHLLLPSFVALVPLALWTARLPAGAAGRREALRGGFVVGLVFYSLLLHWMVAALVVYTPLAVPAFLAAVLLLAALLAAAALGMHAAVTRLGWPVWVAVPVFWTAMEWARAHLGDLSFPWMQLGDSLSGWPRLVGAADLVGSRGLSFWLALVSGLLAEAILRWRPPALERWLPQRVPGAAEAVAGSPGGVRPGSGGGGRGAPPGPRPAGRRGAWRPVVAAMVAVAVPLAYSVHRWRTLELRRAARVAVVQPDVPQELKLSAASAADAARSTALRLADGELASERGRLDLVVLPETVVPAVVDPSPAAAGREGTRPAGWIDDLARRLGAPVLYGARGARTSDTGRIERFNAAFLRSPRGRRLGRYAKRRLVPGVETTPFVDAAWLREVLADVLGPRFGGLTPGAASPLLPAGNARFGVLVCFESVFAGLSRRYRLQGADFLVNVTNDAWFGREEPTWSRTSALWQHPAHLVMRAVETRAGVVRSANTGISAIVDPLGRTTRRSALFEPSAFAGRVYTTAGRTTYVRWGDVAGILSAMAAVAGIVAAASRRTAGDRP